MGDDQVEQIIAAYLARRVEGSAEGLDEFLAAHPGHAEALQRRLGLLGLFGDLGPGEGRGTFDVPTRFDGYEVVRELGRGGMGIVYEARQPALQRSVAIKVIAGLGPLSARMRERFAREITTLARVSHPNIIKVFGSGMVAGSAYVVMELVRGASLARSLPAPGTRPDRETVDGIVKMGVKVARALDHAHELGVIHRDVKPANVLLDARGEPVLLDFGLARDDEHESVTRTGEFVGTLLYMAPEQALGQHVDRRADVYGLAATVYHLVTGIPAYSATSIADLVRRIDSGPPKPASRIHSGLASDLSLVLQHALATAPHMRYASCADFADELQAVLERRPILIVRPSRVGRLIRWSRRHPAAALLVVVSIITLGLLASMGWSIHRDWLANDRARREGALEAAQAELLGHNFAAAESILAGACEDWPQDRAAWLLRIVGALSGRGASLLSHRALEADQVERARELLARSPVALQQEPAGVVLASLLATYDSKSKSFDRNWKPPPVDEDLDAASGVRLARILDRVAFRRADAVEVLRRVIRVDPGNFAAYILLAQCLRDAGTLEGYRSAVHAQALQPDKAGPLSTLAQCTLKMPTRDGKMDPNALEEAWQLFELALEVEPRNAVVMADYATALMNLQPNGWESLAERLLREAVALEPIPTARWNLKNLLLIKGNADPREILALLEPVRNHYGWMAIYWGTIADCTYQLGDPQSVPDAALETALEALRRGFDYVDESERHRLHLQEVDLLARAKSEDSRVAMLEAWDRAFEAAPRDAPGLQDLLEPLVVLEDQERNKRWATRALEMHAAGVPLNEPIQDELARQGLTLDPPSVPGIGNG